MQVYNSISSLTYVTLKHEIPGLDPLPDGGQAWHAKIFYRR